MCLLTRGQTEIFLFIARNSVLLGVATSHSGDPFLGEGEQLPFHWGEKKGGHEGTTSREGFSVSLVTVSMNSSSLQGLFKKPLAPS